MKRIFFFNDIKSEKGLCFNKNKSYLIIEEDAHYYWVDSEMGILTSITKTTCNLAYSVEEEEYEEVFY